MYIMEEAASISAYRKTSVMACTFFDLFFLNRGRCHIDDLQKLAISALALAYKLGQ
jgi:hypothetical protein